MDNNLYIRVRGRVLGPYDQEKLQSLARRGQLSRMHELSADGASWVRAANYPELFVGAQVEMPTVKFAAQQAAVAAGDGVALAPAQQPQQPQQQQWHYNTAGAQRGPVDFANLQLLAATGQIKADDVVWAEGMPAWIPASRVPGLFSGSAVQATTAQSDALSDNVCRSAYGSRPWVVFIMIFMFIYAALTAIGGMAELLSGARVQSTFLVAMGIVALLTAMDFVVGGYLLSAYCSRMGGLQYNRHPAALEKVHDSLHAFWIFVAINLIVYLVFIGFIVIMVFAVGVTVPRF
jgi:GYF domain 2